MQRHRWCSEQSATEAARLREAAGSQTLHARLIDSTRKRDRRTPLRFTRPCCGSNLKSSAGPLTMNARISPAIQDSKDDNMGTLDQEIDEVRKSTQHRTMNVTMDSRVTRHQDQSAARCTSPRPLRGRVRPGVEQRCRNSTLGKTVCDLTPRRFGCGIFLPIFQPTIELQAMRV